jgi:hypothetical protein
VNVVFGTINRISDQGKNGPKNSDNLEQKSFGIGSILKLTQVIIYSSFTEKILTF